MTKDPDRFAFLEAKETVNENLSTIKFSLIGCIDEGLVDEEDLLYNEALALLEDARVIGNWDEMEELITRAKTLETDVAVWLSMHGRNSVSLTWPRRSI
jgi:hypothetical protein